MTFQEFTMEHLRQNGLEPDEADSVFVALHNDTAMLPMIGCWHQERDAAPLPVRDALTSNLRRRAVEWIDANKPTHRARAAFASVDER